jgi:hypothetical protein
MGALPDIGEKTFPDAGAPFWGEEMTFFVPAVEFAHDGDPLCIGSPNGEVGPFTAVDLDLVGAELVVQTEVTPFIKKVQIVVG